MHGVMIWNLLDLIRAVTQWIDLEILSPCELLYELDNNESTDADGEICAHSSLPTSTWPN